MLVNVTTHPCNNNYYLEQVTFGLFGAYYAPALCSVLKTSRALLHWIDLGREGGDSLEEENQGVRI